MIRKVVLAFTVFTGVLSEGTAADLVAGGPANRIAPYHRTIHGQVAVIDGRTLWFASRRVTVRLDDIDSCELPQWSFDPKATAPTDKVLAPVPCGAMGKAWLKRTVGSAAVTCRLTGDTYSDVTIGVCRVKGQDLGFEMLRVGWARLITPFPGNSRYFEAQRYAVAARYGMWATYVLDMAEWRRKAIDRTIGRLPLADLNLLGERQSEISPPFSDARRQPPRRDR
jgi:endonuclease YncB( thermonuclease family)